MICVSDAIYIVDFKYYPESNLNLSGKLNCLELLDEILVTWKRSSFADCI